MMLYYITICTSYTVNWYDMHWFYCPMVVVVGRCSFTGTVPSWMWHWAKPPTLNHHLRGWKQQMRWVGLGWKKWDVWGQHNQKRERMEKIDGNSELLKWLYGNFRETLVFFRWSAWLVHDIWSSDPKNSDRQGGKNRTATMSYGNAPKAFWWKKGALCFLWVLRCDLWNESDSAGGIHEHGLYPDRFSKFRAYNCHKLQFVKLRGSFASQWNDRVHLLHLSLQGNLHDLRCDLVITVDFQCAGVHWCMILCSDI